MAPIVTLILSKILDYLADHADEIIQKIKDQFLSAREDPEVVAALQEFGYAPNEETLNKLHDTLEAKGEDPKQLAKILVNETTVA